ncbi:MAG: hypothetical protein ACOCVF_00190 [bacterium]
MKQKQMSDGVLMRDLLGKMRKLNEVDITHDQSNRIETHFDQKNEEEKFINYLRSHHFNVIPNSFEKLEVVPEEYVFFGGTIDNMLQFVFTVTDSEQTSKVEFNYSNEFNRENPDNIDLIDKIQEYYDIFYRYWSDNNFNLEDK